jgi:hypothetical protein
MSDEWIETDFELNEQVFVPASDGAPAQWKPKADLLVGEFARHVEWLKVETDLQGERVRRYIAIRDQAERRCGGNHAARFSDVLTREEIDEYWTLKRTLDAQEREQDRRQAAIDRDIAAGRYRVLRWKDAERGHG